MLKVTVWGVEHRTGPYVHLALLMFALGLLLQADTIVVSVPGPVQEGGNGVQSDGPLASSWSSTLTYAARARARDVSISAMLSSNWPGILGTAYLTTRIGTGASMTDEVARSNFIFPEQPQLFTLFSNLTLPPSTYYLVLTSSGSPLGPTPTWVDAYTCDPNNPSSALCVPPTVITGPGVSRNEDFVVFAGGQAPYAPASDFFQGGGIRGDPFFDYNVVSAGTESIPEPSSFALLLLGAVAGIFRKVLASSCT